MHGCLDELKALCLLLKLTPSDHLYFAGDVVNRGPDSLGCLKFIRNLPCVVKGVLGNHELSLLNIYDQMPSTGLRRLNLHSLESLAITLKDQAPDLIEWLKTWPLIIESDDWILVHAGVSPDRPLPQQEVDTLTRVREWNGKPWYEHYPEQAKPIIYGHWAAQGLHLRKNTFGIDSGCVWGGRLSALIWPSRMVISVPALRAYAVSS